MVKVVATADLHGELPDIPECDLLLIAGDVCPDGSALFQGRWLANHFRKWLEKAPAKEIVGIAGNHDVIFEHYTHFLPNDLPWHYLQDEAKKVLGFKIYGTPWQLPFWGAFNLDEAFLRMQYQKVPSDIDIFISHGPPKGILDKVGTEHTGSSALRDKIAEIQPKLFVCGHIHCDTGTRQIDKTLYANVSLLNNDMKISHPPFVFELQHDNVHLIKENSSTKNLWQANSL